MQFNGHKEMGLALEQAKIAASKGEVPIGAVLVDRSGNIIASAHNQVEISNDATAHAEMLVLKSAAQKLKDNNRLQDCTLYVTIEPCAMCAAAISHSRISKLVFGALDEKGGGVEHGAKIFSHATTMFKPEVVSGVMEEECRELMQSFFKKLR